jgi:hypothetical protein
MYSYMSGGKISNHRWVFTTSQLKYKKTKTEQPKTSFGFISAVKIKKFAWSHATCELWRNMHIPIIQNGGQLIA